MERGGGRIDAPSDTTLPAAPAAPPALADSSSAPSATTSPTISSHAAPSAASGHKKKKDKPVAALDFFSPSFDPLLALNTPGLRPPIPDVKPLLSVQMCRSLLPDTHIDYKPPKPITLPADEKQSEEGDTAAGKRALARQPPLLPPAATSALTLFTTAARVPPPYTVGPLSLLQSLVATQQRCRLLLRSHHSLHTILTGQLRAFDRHCNLYLVDVQQWQLTAAQLTVSERQRRKGRRADGGRRWEWVEVERRVGVWQNVWVGQMMIRGECVISVSRCSEASEAADAEITGTARERNSNG